MSTTFSTAAKVYPAHLPHQMHHLHQTTAPTATRRMPAKVLTTLAVVGAASYGVNTYMSHARDRRLAEARMAEQAELARRRALEDLADEYGGRDSLEELERAVRFYEKK